MRARPGCLQVGSTFLKDPPLAVPWQGLLQGLSIFSIPFGLLGTPRGSFISIPLLLGTSEYFNEFSILTRNLTIIFLIQYNTELML